MQNTRYRSKSFIYLSLATAFLTIGLIIFGAVVRVTDSGLGCGNNGPYAMGSFSAAGQRHRMDRMVTSPLALLIGLFGLATLAVAWRAYRARDNRVLGMTVFAAVLYMVQSGLGAMVVVLDLPPTFVTLHLGVAMLLLASLLIAAVLAWYRPREGYHADSVTMLTYMNAGFAFLIILTGALVRGSGATLACTKWPLCNNGMLIPFEQGQLAVIHMLHRFAVGALGITVLILIWQVMKNRSEPLVRQLAVASGVLYLLQVGVGALFVLSVAGPEWGAAHVGLAATTWGVLVVLAVVETVNNRQVTTSRTETEWQPLSETASA